MPGTGLEAQVALVLHPSVRHLVIRVSIEIDQSVSGLTLGIPQGRRYEVGYKMAMCNFASDSYKSMTVYKKGKG